MCAELLAGDLMSINVGQIGFRNLFKMVPGDDAFTAFSTIVSLPPTVW
jgi:hypothetical protein